MEELLEYLSEPSADQFRDIARAQTLAALNTDNANLEHVAGAVERIASDTGRLPLPLVREFSIIRGMLAEAMAGKKAGWSRREARRAAPQAIYQSALFWRILILGLLALEVAHFFGYGGRHFFGR